MKIIRVLCSGALISVITLLMAVPQAHARTYASGTFVCAGIGTIDQDGPNNDLYAADCYNSDYELFGQAYVRGNYLELDVWNGQHGIDHCSGSVQCTASFGSWTITEGVGQWSANAPFVPTSVSISCKCQ